MTGARSSTPFSTSTAPAALGGCCPAICPTGRRSTTTSDSGARTARSTESTTRCASRCGSRRGARPSPRRGLSTRSRSSAETVGKSTRGYDAGKKINGRKRHIVVDTLGLLLVVMVTVASVQDREGGRSIIELLRKKLPSVRHIFADGGYLGELVKIAQRTWKIAVEIVKRAPDQKGFAVLPRRWVVERTFAWLMRCRRLVRDYESLAATHEALVKWGMIGMMLNRLAPPVGTGPWELASERRNTILECPWFRGHLSAWVRRARQEGCGVHATHSSSVPRGVLS
jgi:transposase